MPYARQAFGRLVTAVVAVICFAGCTMCPNPFDYAGPVPNGSAPQNDFQARSNGVIPIGITPRPWPPLVKREADAKEPAIVATAPKAKPTLARESDINDGVMRVDWSPDAPTPDGDMP